MLLPYREWSPTAFDHKGLACDDQQDWLVCPVMRTRDSGPLDRTNFGAFLQGLRDADPERNDHEDHRFGHWGPGWFEIILVRPGTAVEKAARTMANALADYPVLDEMALSEAEHEEASENYSHRDAVFEITRALGLADSTQDRLRNVDQESLFAFLDPEIVSDDSSAYYDLRGAAGRIDRQRMADFLRKECR